MNLYAYIRNDPLNGVDPSGRERLGLFAEANFAYDLGVHASLEVSFDTESHDVRIDAELGPRVGYRLGANVGGFAERSRSDGLSVNAAIEVEASAAGEINPSPVGGEIGGRLTLLEGSASTERGLSGDALRPEAILEGSVGGLTVSSDRVSGSLGVDVGASGGGDLNVGASVPLRPVINLFREPEIKSDKNLSF